MKTIILTVAAGALTVVALNLAYLKYLEPEFEVARREVSQQSQRRVEGVSQSIAALCLSMDTAEKAEPFANLILHEAAGQPTLLPEARHCVNRAQQILNVGA